MGHAELYVRASRCRTEARVERNRARSWSWRPSSWIAGAQQIFLQHSAGLDEQTAANRFVGYAHALVVTILNLQPTTNLLRRSPESVYSQPASEISPGKPEGNAWAAKLNPGSVIGFIGPLGLPSIRRAPNLWQYHESTNRKSVLEKCSLAQGHCFRVRGFVRRRSRPKRVSVRTAQHRVAFSQFGKAVPLSSIPQFDGPLIQ